MESGGKTNVMVIVIVIVIVMVVAMMLTTIMHEYKYECKQLQTPSHT